MKKFVMAVALCLGLFTACNDDEVFYDPEKAGETYYPLQVGDSWTYQVTDITFLNNVGDTTEFEQKEEIDTIVTDQAGKKWYRVQISRKEEDEINWVPSGVKFISRTSTDLRVMTNNITEVLMVFPVSNGKTWNPNAYNSKGEAEYTFENVGIASNVNGSNYDVTAKIVKSARSNSTVANEQWETLANGVGPVYRYYNVVNYCSEGGGINCPDNFITDGTKREEKLISHTRAQ